MSKVDGLFNDSHFLNRKSKGKSLEMSKSQSSKVNLSFSTSKDSLVRIYCQHLVSGKSVKPLNETAFGSKLMPKKLGNSKQLRITRKSMKKYLGSTACGLAKQNNQQKNELFNFRKKLEKNSAVLNTSQDPLGLEYSGIYNFRSLDNSKKCNGSISEFTLENPVYCQSFNSELNNIEFKASVVKIFKRFEKKHIDIREKFSNISIN